MYRARSVVVGLLPFLPGAAPRRMATWLTSGPASSLTQWRHYSASAPPPPPASVAAEPFLNGSSSVYIEEMYNAWLVDPKSVHAVSPLPSFPFVLNT